MPHLRFLAATLYCFSRVVHIDASPFLGFGSSPSYQSLHHSTATPVPPAEQCGHLSVPTGVQCYERRATAQSACVELEGYQRVELCLGKWYLDGVVNVDFHAGEIGGENCICLFGGNS